MNLTLHLTDQLEVRLRERALREGKEPATVALEALADQLSMDETEQRPASIDAWLAQVDALAASMPAGNAHAEFDRDSIYEGRGE